MKKKRLLSGLFFDLLSKFFEYTTFEVAPRDSKFSSLIAYAIKWVGLVGLVYILKDKMEILFKF